MEKNKLGDRIKDKRKAMRLTQQDLSGPTLSRALVSLIERNQTAPSLKTLEKIAEKLGTTVSELLQEDIESDEESESSGSSYQKVVLMAKALIRTGNFDQAKDAIEKGLLKEESPEGRGTYKKLLGEIYFQQKDYSYALSNFKDTLFYFSPVELEDHIEMHYYLAECNRKLKDYHSAIEHALRAISLLQSIHQEPDVVLELKILYSISYSYCQIEQYDSGVNYIEEALQLSEESTIYYRHSDFLILKGLAYMYLNNYLEGIESTKTALLNYQKTTKYKEVAKCLINLGILYRKDKDYSHSLEYLEKSLLVSREHGLQRQYGNSLYELCLTLHEKGSIAGALQTGKDALKTEEFPGYLRGKLFFVLGMIQMDFKNYQQALVYFDQAEESFLDIADQLGLSKCQLKKSSIYYYLEQYEEAHDLLKEGYKKLDRYVG